MEARVVHFLVLAELHQIEQGGEVFVVVDVGKPFAETGEETQVHPLKELLTVQS